VLYRGVEVGSVQAISFDQEGIVLRAKLDNPPPIPKDSEFVVATTDLLSGKAIEIRPGKADALLSSGARVQGRSVTGVMEMTADLGGITERVNAVLENLQDLTAETSGDEVDQFLAGLNQATADLAETIEASRGALRRTLANLEEISDESRRPLTSILSELDKTVKDVSKTVEEVDRATKDIQRLAGELSGMATDLKRGKGTLGKLISEETLYENVNHSLYAIDLTLAEVRALATDLRENPDRYFTVKIF
jgi:phospholipid/cholesterol/gamma-HCH transport system substrate-binding protein